ncbi:hypothetical protein LC55x_2218 [Lysobacter capsici]|nr:hypothetical protein LC55x_2218 [Lysobacter capsici]
MWAARGRFRSKRIIETATKTDPIAIVIEAGRSHRRNAHPKPRVEPSPGFRE